MKSVINRNYESSELLINLIELVADKLQIEIPSADDLPAYENEQDERYIIFDEIYNYLTNTLQISNNTLLKHEIAYTGDLLTFYAAYYMEFH